MDDMKRILKHMTDKEYNVCEKYLADVYGCRLDHAFDMMTDMTGKQLKELVIEANDFNEAMKKPLSYEDAKKQLEALYA